MKCLSYVTSQFRRRPQFVLLPTSYSLVLPKNWTEDGPNLPSYYRRTGPKMVQIFLRITEGLDRRWSKSTFVSPKDWTEDGSCNDNLWATAASLATLSLSLRPQLFHKWENCWKEYILENINCAINIVAIFLILISLLRLSHTLLHWLDRENLFHKCIIYAVLDQMKPSFMHSVLYVLVWATRGAVIAHRYIMRLLAAEPRSIRLLFLCQYLCGTILVTPYSMMWNWRVSRAGPMLFFYWSGSSLPFWLLLFSISLVILWVGI